MRTFLRVVHVLLVAIFIYGCGKKSEEQQSTAQIQQTNTLTSNTNKLATFVQPKPRTNISIQISPAQKTAQSGTKAQSLTNVQAIANTNLKISASTVPQVPPSIPQLPVDYGSEQVESLKTRASNGDTGAQLELASRYLYGRGVEKNETEGLQWLSMAAQSGNPVAQNRLGLLYATGQAVQRDPTQAVYWYTLAAEQNHPTAQNNLGIMYATGNGVEKNDIEAYKWLTLAGQRITNAILYRDTLVKTMTPEQIETAKKQVEEFMSRFTSQNPPPK